MTRVAPLLFVAALTACQTTPPASTATGSAPAAIVSASMAADALLGPVVGQCIDYAARGTAPDAARLAAAGFTGQTSLGEKTWIRTIKPGAAGPYANLRFHKSGDRCTLSQAGLTHGATDAKGWIAAVLRARGFTKVGEEGDVARYTGGGATIILRSYDQFGAAHTIIQRAG